MSLGRALLPLHLLPGVEVDVDRFDEQLFVSLLDLLLQCGHVNTAQGLSVHRDEVGRYLVQHGGETGTVAHTQHVLVRTEVEGADCLEDLVLHVGMVQRLHGGVLVDLQ